MINRTIFREYDIRGIAETDLTDSVAVLIGKAFGTIIRRQHASSDGKHRVAVGRDIRLSSNRIRSAIVDGITLTGVNVVDIGECPTPLLYFATYTCNVDGGIMITASHNPPEYNGLKICIGKETIYGAQIQRLLSITEEGNFERETRGKVENIDIINSYLPFLMEKFTHLLNDKKKIKVVIDAGNGTGGMIAPKLLSSLGIEVVPLYCDPDGNFPNHHPDPTVPENLEVLIDTVIKHKADMGVAYDGDADRLGVVDEKGSILWGDQLMILFSRDILKESVATNENGKNDRPAFVGEVKSSQVMYDDIEKNGGRAIMWKAGHSLIKDKMKKEKAALAGEVSGHLFFADRYFGFDDAVYATCRLVEILKKEEKPLSKLLSDLPKAYNTPEIRISCPDEKKFKIVEEMKKILARNYKIIDIDGVRVVFDKGWGLIRASNTGPVLVMRFEASTQKKLKEYRELVENLLKEVSLAYIH